MARGNLSACLAVTLVHEGGYVDHPSDPGGATNLGITHKALATFRGGPVTKLDVRNLKLPEATKIYERDYWSHINGELLPYGVDLGAFDSAVNSGPSRGAKWLQRAAGVKQDGKIGPATLRAVADKNGKAIIQAMCGYRLSFVQGLGTFKVFGKGWSRRIADIEAKGVAMWLRASGLTASEVAVQMNREAGTAAGKAEQNTKASTGAAGGGVVAGGGDYLSGGTGWLLVGAVLLILIGLGLLVKSRQNSARAAAYAEEAGK